MNQETIQDIRKRHKKEYHEAIIQLIVFNPDTSLSKLAILTDTTMREITTIARQYDVNRRRGFGSASHPRRKEQAVSRG
jgi:hypothetical protein